MTTRTEPVKIGRLFYRELAPRPSLDHLVFSFWEFTVRGDDPAPISHEIFPDGCISIIYRRNERLGIAGLVTTNLNKRTIVVPVFFGDIFWGMRLSPAACAGILGSDPAQMEHHLWTDEVGVTEYGLLDRELLRELATASTLDEAASIFERRLFGLKIDRAEIDAQVLAAVTLIEVNRGEIRIAAVAEEVSLSVRQFERRFKKCSGLTPKQYARTRRLRAAAVVLAGDEPINWADRAAELGFADQAHLTHEFTAITGRSPKSLARKVKSIEHGNLE
ncbi:MAG: AraC family transcriptional regulator [Pyrinomonadaceae bacterium]